MELDASPAATWWDDLNLGFNAIRQSNLTQVVIFLWLCIHSIQSLQTPSFSSAFHENAKIMIKVYLVILIWNEMGMEKVIGLRHGKISVLNTSAKHTNSVREKEMYALRWRLISLLSSHSQFIFVAGRMRLLLVSPWLATISPLSLCFIWDFFHQKRTKRKVCTFLWCFQMLSLVRLSCFLLLVTLWWKCIDLTIFLFGFTQ